MLKPIGLVLAVLLPILVVKPESAKFHKYKAVETYEVRPGILMMPHYANDGHICQLELEKRHYSNETAFLDSKIPHEVMIQIIDELVPPNERGPQMMNFGTEYMSEYSGNRVTTIEEYKNVSIEIYSEASSAGDIVALIKWKNQKCQ